MLGRIAIPLILAALLAGCVTAREGVEFSALSQKVGPPKPGHARIVVMRDPGFAGLIDGGWQVKLNGEPMAPLKTGTFTYADRPAGRHQLSHPASLLPATEQTITLAPGRTYFFLARTTERAKTLNAMHTAGGLTGFVIAAALTSGDKNDGFLEFIPMEEGAARQLVAELKLAQ